MGFWDPTPDDARDPPGLRTVLVICCPECGNDEILLVSTGHGFKYWECPACKHRWKTRATAGLKKVWIA
jgi:hypothetical protein